MTEHNSGRWYQERVEAYLDGELEGGELRMFEARLELDPKLAAAVAQARKLQAALDDIPHYRCPPDLADKVMRITDTEPRRWPWAVAATLAVAAIGATLSLDQRQPAEPDRTAELAAARHDLAVALAYLDKAGAAAGREVGAQWIRPVEKSLAAVEDKAG